MPHTSCDDSFAPPTPPPRRRRRAAWWLLVLLVLVGGAIAIAPSVLVPVLEARLSTASGADVRLGWISWSPLVGRVVLHRVAIAPTSGTPAVVTAQSVAVDVALRRWLGGERALDALVLRRPWVALHRTEGGDFNLPALFPAVKDDAGGTAAPASGEMGPPVPFRIGTLRIVNGSVEFRDETTVPALETSLYLDDAAARDLVLASDGSTGLAFHVESRIEHEPLTLDVSYDNTPGSSHLTATFVAANTSLARALLYVPLGWQRTSGTMDATLRYERRIEDNVLRRHDLQADLALHDLALTEPWAKEPMLRAKHVRVPALNVDFIKQRSELGAIHVEDFQALVIRDAEGVHVPLAGGSSGTEASTWHTTLDRVTLGKGTAVLRLAEPELVVPLQSGTVRLPPNEVIFSFAGTIAGGRVALDGRSTTAATILSFTLEDLSLVEVPHLLGFPLPFAKGRLHGRLEVRVGDEPSTFTGSVTTTDAGTVPSEEHPEDVLAWQRLELTVAESRFDPLRLHITQATATWPYVMLHRRPDGWFPLTLAQTGMTSSSSSAGAPDPETPWLRLDGVTVQGGRIEFYDSTFPKPYGIDLTDLTASADAVSLAPLRAERVALKGALDELSPFEVGGTIAAAGAHLSFAVERLLLPPLNCYLAPLLGYEVKTGLARITSKVRLADTTLVAENDVTLSRFAMRAAGQDTVAAKIGTPLSVALALMKDTHGDIHLDLPIEGDMKVNQYRVGSLLREALGDALLGTLRAPLGFLRGIFSQDSGEQFDLRPVPFPAGSATLEPEGEARIIEVARLLGRQTALRAVLIPEPSHADLESFKASGAAHPIDSLVELARTRAAVVSERLTKGQGIAAGRVTTEDWQPAEPEIEGDPGVDVQLRTD